MPTDAPISTHPHATRTTDTPTEDGYRLGILGETATIGGFTLTAGNASTLHLEALLPKETWAELSTDPRLGNTVDIVDREILLPMQIDRELLGALPTRMQAPHCTSLAELEELRAQAVEAAKRLQHLSDQLIDALAPQMRVKTETRTAALGERSATISATSDDRRSALDEHAGLFETLCKLQGIEHHRILQDLGKHFARRESELAPRVIEPPAEAQRSRSVPATEASQRAKSPDELLPAAQGHIRLAENPLREAIADCTLLMCGKATKEMMRSLAQAAPGTKLSENSSNWHVFAHSLGQNTVGFGYNGPSTFPEYSNAVAALHRAASSREADIRLRELSRATLSGSPVGVIDLSFAEAQPQGGFLGKARRLIGAPHVEMRMTLLSSGELNSRGVLPADQIHHAVIIGLNAALPVELAERLRNNLRDVGAERLVRDLMEFPPDGRGGRFTAWLRDGLLQPLLTRAGEKAPPWSAASAAQREFAFRHYALTSFGNVFGKAQDRITDLCALLAP